MTLPPGRAAHVGEPRGQAATRRTAVKDRLIERSSEISLIEGALRQAQAGAGRTIVIEAPNGLGKSSMLAAAGDLGRNRGFSVLDAKGREHEQDFAFGAVLQLFEQRNVSTELERLLSGSHNAVEPLLESGSGERESIFKLLHSLYRLVVQLADHAPLMLAVDDVEFVDAETVRFLLYLTERASALRVMILVAGVPVLGFRETRPLRRLLRHPEVTRAQLKPLSPEGAACRVRTFLPEASGELAEAVYDATRGNPQLIREVVTDLSRAEQHAPRTDAASLALDSIADYALGRASVAATDGPALLRAIATMGDDAEVRRAAKLTGLEYSAAARLAERLIGIGLLRRGENLSFREPIVRRAIEATTSPAETASLHLRAASMLAEEEASPEAVAHHLARSARAGSPWSVEKLMEAASAARARGAPLDAVGYLRRALAEPPQREQRAKVLLELGRAEATAGEPEAISHLTEATDRIADPRERATLALDVGRTLFTFGRHAEAARALERGIVDLHGRSGALEAQLRSELAMVSRLQSTWDRSAAPEEESPPPDGDSPAGRVHLARLSLEESFRGEPRDRVVDLAARALGRGALLEEDTSEGLAYYLACEAMTVAEEFAVAEAALALAVEDAATRGSVLGCATARFFRSLAVLGRGRIREAAADARHALTAERYGWGLALPAAHAVIAEALLEAGQLERASRHVEAAEGTADDTAGARVAWLSARGTLALAVGDHSGAIAHMLQCGELLEQLGSGNPALVPWRSCAALSHAAQGERERGRELACEELLRAEAFGAPGAIGRALRRLALIEEGERALELLSAAVERLDGSQRALERAKSLVDFGARLRRSGRRRDAREPLHRGLDLAERCGADLLAMRARQEIAAAGARPRRTAVTGRDALTARERQVAQLAAEGRSNREIAEALVVTLKTVEWHLRHAYRKLGVNAREQLPEALRDGSVAG